MNYPDDIRQYDNDPRSPFYEAPPYQCNDCGWIGDYDDTHLHVYTGEAMCPECNSSCIEKATHEQGPQEE